MDKKNVDYTRHYVEQIVAKAKQSYRKGKSMKRRRRLKCEKTNQRRRRHLRVYKRDLE